MDRLFLDANILFSAAWGSSAIARIWDAARDGRALLLTSAYALDEARRNLSDADQVGRLDDLVRDLTIVPETLSTTQCPVALAANAAQYSLRQCIAKRRTF